MSAPPSPALATALRGYRPGEWFAVLGEHAVVLLPPSEKSRVGDLWALLDDGAGFDVVLDALISTGLRDLPGFVLVATDQDSTRVVVRGPGSATATTRDGEEVVVEGREASTWVERTLTGVRALRLHVGDVVDPEQDEEELTIRGGLVRVRSLSQPPAQPVTEAPAPPVTEAVPGVPPPWPGTPAPATEPGQQEPEREEPREQDDDTVAGLLPESVLPESVEDARGPATTARPVARLVFSHGDDVTVDRPVLVGRSPETRRFTSEEQPRLVQVPSPQQEISSTHLEIRPGTGADHGSAVVTDLGSTNGSVLVQPGLPPEDLRPGIPVQLVPGAVIDLGDGVTIQVVNPG